METQIRPAGQADAESIAVLAGELGYPCAGQPMHDRLVRILGRTDQLVLVADIEGVVGGWLQARSTDVLESGFRVEIVGLVVSVKFRRQGAGRKLIEAVERWAASLGASHVVVRSNTQRIESQSFYPALGYAATKTQLVYRKQISPSA